MKCGEKTKQMTGETLLELNLYFRRHQVLIGIKGILMFAVYNFPNYTLYPKSSPINAPLKIVKGRVHLWALVGSSPPCPFMCTSNTRVLFGCVKLTIGITTASIKTPTARSCHPTRQDSCLCCVCRCDCQVKHK